MILPFLEQQPLYNSINFNLSVAYHAERHVQPDRAQRLPLPVGLRARRSSRSSRTRPTRPTPAATTASHIVDTLSRGNYVGMYGIGEICSQSGAIDAAEQQRRRARWASTPGSSTATARRRSPPITDGTSNTIMVGERSHNLSYVTWVARSIDGWLGKTSPIEGGTDQFNPSPEECWTQIMGPAGLEDGTRTINNPEAHVEDYWSMHPGGANMLFADGSVHFLKSSINPVPWRALATRAFGEVISADSLLILSLDLHRNSGVLHAILRTTDIVVRLHPDRAPGRDRDHRRPDLAACCPRCNRPARRPGGLSAPTISSSSGWPCTAITTPTASSRRAISSSPAGTPSWARPTR